MDKNGTTAAELLQEVKNKNKVGGTSFRGISLYGSNMISQREESTCKVFHIKNETGTGEISCYSVFEGVELFYNDIHAAYCNHKQATAKNIVEINHCREGRYECSFGESSC